MTEGQLNRMARDFKLYAQEEVKVELINDTVYAFGSEVATLRILNVYRFFKSAKHDYSRNLNTHYFSLTL